MPRSQDWIKLLAEVIVDDVRSERSVVRYFLSNTLKGGWEGWLQVVYARAVIANDPGLIVFNRETTFPGTNQRCDLFFSAPRGTSIWMELKTQRSAEYAGTVEDFRTSIRRLLDLPPDVKSRDVLVAVAVLKPRSGDPARLNGTRGEFAGQFSYYALAATHDTATGEDVTDNIATRGIRDDELLLATWRF